MTKLTLDDYATLVGLAAAVNANNAKVEAEFEKVLYRDGTAPNTMSASLDMNSNKIINLPAAQSSAEPVRKAEFDSAVLGAFEGAVGTANIADAAVTTPKIADSAVTTPKIADSAVTLLKLHPDLVQTSSETGTTPDNQLPTVQRAQDLINASLGLTVFDSTADVEAAAIPTTATFLSIPGVGAVADFLPATPSPVKPWHVLSDNGRYFELRFPDGRVNVKAFGAAGNNTANDTNAFKAAFDYINRGWWESGTAGQGKWQRGRVYVPPGIFLIDPTDPPIAFDYLKIEGAGDGQSMIKASSTSAGSLFLRSSVVTYNTSQRTTHTTWKGMRFILTGTAQTALDLAHCGRMRITECEFTQQDRDDQYNNANQTPRSDTRGVRLRNNNATFVGGDIVTIDHSNFYFLDKGIDSGNGTTAPGPETLTIRRCELSDNLNPIVINEAGGARGLITDCIIQRWAVGSRAIDIVGTKWGVENTYFEATDNTVPAVLFRTGASECWIDKPSCINYTEITELLSNDGTGSLTRTYGAA